MKQSLMTTAFLILFIGFGFAKEYASFNSVCGVRSMTSRQLFRDLKHNHAECSWDPLTAFRDGRKLGKGSFGLVKKVSYTDSMKNTFEIALKEMHPNANEKAMILREISAMDSMNEGKSPYVAQLHGCYVVEEYPFRVYLAQERLGYDLDSTSFISFYQMLKPADSISIVIQMFKGLRDLWAVGYSHNDIKPANMMARKNNNKSIVLIDLGLAERVGARHFMGGTPLFMSPARFTAIGKIMPKDDIYSMAISVLVMEAKHGFDDVFRGITSKTYGTAYYGCFEKHLNSACRQKIAQNGISILQRANYGTYDRNQSLQKGVNLTTLIANMILYDNYNFDHAQTVELIRHIESTLNSGKDQAAGKFGKADANEIRLRQMQVAKLEKEKSEAKDAKRAAKRLNNQENMKSKQFFNGAQNKQDDAYLQMQKKLAQEAMERENRLKLLKAEAQAKKQKFVNYNRGFVQDSEMYKNSKDMFKSIRRTPQAYNDLQGYMENKQQFVNPYVEKFLNNEIKQTPVIPQYGTPGQIKKRHVHEQQQFKLPTPDRVYIPQPEKKEVPKNFINPPNYGQNQVVYVDDIRGKVVADQKPQLIQYPVFQQQHPQIQGNYHIPQYGNLPLNNGKNGVMHFVRI